MQMDNLRGLLGIKKINSMQNVQVRERREVTKVVDERINERVF